MRVLLATDGSASAERARDLVAGLPWPHGTTVRVLTAIDVHLDMLGAPFAVVSGDVVDELDTQLLQHAELTLDQTERGLVDANLTVERVSCQQRAADAIVGEARAWPADIVVLGSRGHSTLATMLLGSTCAEVVDHAPCPVLVARDGSIGEVVLATDGSPCAMAAEQVLLDWPMFRDLPTAVVSVAPASSAWPMGLAAGVYEPTVSLAATDDLARAAADDAASAAARRLRDGGIDAVAQPMDGDAAATIVKAARAASRSLIVMGSRGRTGLARLVLGGVARNVLVHASGSVLIVRRGVRVAPCLPVDEATRSDPTGDQEVRGQEVRGDAGNEAEHRRLPVGRSG